jgi:uncharacterized protein (UPF0335 family)
LDKREKPVLAPCRSFRFGPKLATSSNHHKSLEEQTVQLQTSAKDQLRAFVSRIERLEEEKAALSADLKEVYAEAKGNGFDVKALRKLISIRKQDDDKRREEEMILATYLRALGMDEEASADASEAA